jgi:cytoskeletal protein RodZ
MKRIKKRRIQFTSTAASVLTTIVLLLTPANVCAQSFTIPSTWRVRLPPRQNNHSKLTESQKPEITTSLPQRRTLAETAMNISLTALPAAPTPLNSASPSLLANAEDILKPYIGPTLGTAARLYAELADYDHLTEGTKYRDILRGIFEGTARGIPEFEKNL